MDENRQAAEWYEDLGAEPCGYAQKADNMPPFQRLWVAADENFCRHCEYPVHAGEPFTFGAHGKYCRFCLEREGWVVVWAPPLPPTLPHGGPLPPDFFRGLFEGQSGTEGE